MADLALHYRLLGDALPNEEKRIRTSYLPTLVLIVAASTMVFLSLGIGKGATPKSMMSYGLVMTGCMVCLVVWYPRRIRRRLIRCWETYDLEIGSDYLVRRQADVPDLRLEFDEVQAVEHVQGRYLRVIGKSKGRVIAIPEGIDQFAEVLKTISSIRPARVRTIEQWLKYRAFMAVGLLLYVVMLWSTAPAVVIPLSLVTGSMIVWVFFWIQRNANIPVNTKRIGWIYWLFFVVCVLKVFAVSPNLPLQPATIIGATLVFSPAVLVGAGWVAWSRTHPARCWRNYSIACSLATATSSALCLYSVLLYVRVAHISYVNVHRLAIAGVYAGFPLSAFSVVAAAAGKGRARVIVCLAACFLAFVWSIVFFYA